MVDVRVPPWPGSPSAQGVSRLVASAPRHLDHRMGRASASFDGKSSFPDGRGASRVRRASRPPAAELEPDHCGPEACRHKGSRGSSLALLGTSTIGWEGPPGGRTVGWEGVSIIRSPSTPSIDGRGVSHVRRASRPTERWEEACPGVRSRSALHAHDLRVVELRAAGDVESGGRDLSVELRIGEVERLEEPVRHAAGVEHRCA